MADDHLRQIFSIVVPFISMFGGPYLNSWLTTASPVVRYAISALVGMLIGGLGSEYTAYPMHLDAAVEAGATMGITGQKLLVTQAQEGKVG